MLVHISAHDNFHVLAPLPVVIEPPLHVLGPVRQVLSTVASWKIFALQLGSSLLPIFVLEDAWICTQIFLEQILEVVAAKFLRWIAHVAKLILFYFICLEERLWHG